MVEVIAPELMSPGMIEECYVSKIQQLCPTGLNPKELWSHDACEILEELETLDGMRTFCIITADPPPTKEELLVIEVNKLAGMGGRRWGKHPNHRHPI